MLVLAWLVDNARILLNDVEIADDYVAAFGQDLGAWVHNASFAKGDFPCEDDLRTDDTLGRASAATTG